MATDYINHFDRQQTPECTEGREGYIWFNGIQAGQNEAVLKANIRDFDKDNFAARKQQIADVAALIAAQYPTAKVDYRIEETYSNISNAIGEDRRAIDLMFEAMESLGITPKPTPMRGGTDGAALSAKGYSPRTSSPARITSTRSLNSAAVVVRGVLQHRPADLPAGRPLSGLARQHRGKAQLDAVAVFIGAVQFANVFVVFEQLPAFVVVAQLTAFERKREADGARVIRRIHRGNDQVVTARRGAALHIGDKSRDGFCLQEHQHHGGENKSYSPSKLRLLRSLIAVCRLRSLLPP
jgi:hypothetical protein